MQAVLDKDLMAMKVTELKEELAARGEALSGNKAWLRRRLHAAIVRAHLEAAGAGGGGGLLGFYFCMSVTGGFSVLLRFCAGHTFSVLLQKRLTFSLP
jgi:hypothetical protein